MSSGNAAAWAILGSVLYAAVAGTSLVLTIVMALLAFGFAGVGVAAKLGKIKLPLASVSVWAVVGPVLAGVLTLGFGLSMHQERQRPSAPETRVGHDGADAGSAVMQPDAHAVASPPSVAELVRLLRQRDVEGAVRIFSALPIDQRQSVVAAPRSCREVTLRSGGAYSTEHDGEIVDWVVNVTAVDEASAMGGFMVVFKCGVPGLHLYAWSNQYNADPSLVGRRRIIGRLTKNAFGMLEVRSALFVDPAAGQLIAHGLP